MPAPEIIHQLMRRFSENREAYRSGRYNEAQLRIDFLNPFFEALGWDVTNVKGYAPDYREVITEDSIDVEGGAKAPDYAFKIGKERKFFVEAKKPAVDIQYDIHPAYQVRRYAWNAHLPLSILTDFEELAVYDCRSKPDPTDKAATGRVNFYTYNQYAEKWDEIAAVFSREAVLKGSFDKYAEGSKGKRGTSEVDDAFLAEIEQWRELLARNLALRNPGIEKERSLNYAVQMTIDRIIFLRICEDRGMEAENQLQDIAKQPGIYPALVELFRKADRKYNSGLFHFTPEGKGDNGADSFTPGLIIDDKVLKEIIKSIYYPCPYIFKEIPVEILGQVYEQFLGKVIRLTAGHQAKVEEKPEVRKAGGVYYTPTYIVDYIVKNTVGKLLEDSTPEKAAALKVVDPACGSGSFLLGAYQYLLDWHLNWYSANDAEKYARGQHPALAAAQGGGWELTTAEKKRILLNNIHGVDIDPQAVEVTKLSLLLKVLEEETGQLSLGLERALPDLSRNIQCGNSLIGPDYYEGRQLGLGFTDEEEQYRVNAFNWQTAFPQVFAQGGFDAVIGNPPYRMMQPHNTEPEILDYFRKKYLVADFKIELFHMFLQLGISLVKQNGFHSYIIPATILNNVYAEKLRNWIMERCCIKIISVADEKVFESADVHTLVLILQLENDQEIRRENRIQISVNLNKRTAPEIINYNYSLQRHLLSLPGAIWNLLISDKNAPLIIRLLSSYDKLENIAKLNRGLITGDRDKFFSKTKQTKDYIPIITGSDVNRYVVNEPKEYVLFKKPKGAGGSWDSEIHLAPHKMLVRQIGTRPMAGFIQKPFAVTGNLFTVITEYPEDELFIMGIFNSRLIEFLWKILFFDFKSTFPQVTLFSLSQIPIISINKSDHDEKQQFDGLVSLVKKMIELLKRTVITPHEKDMLERQIAETDAAIDRLVYQLYGLTEEEIKIVEGG